MSNITFEHLRMPKNQPKKRVKQCSTLKRVENCCTTECIMNRKIKAKPRASIIKSAILLVFPLTFPC